MRSAGNFNPEWGYLASAPSFARTTRIAAVSLASGAIAGAGVVYSLVDRPAVETFAALNVQSAKPSAPTQSNPSSIIVPPAGIAELVEPPATTGQKKAAKKPSVNAKLPPANWRYFSARANTVQPRSEY